MFKSILQKGVSLVSALLLMIVVSMAIALIGYLAVSSIQVKGTLKTYKTTKEAAESVAYTIINEIDSGNLAINCDHTVGCSNNEKGCQIKIPPNIEKAIKASGLSYNATLLRNCTDGVNQIYTIKVEVNKNNRIKTNIFFIYED